ncbi:MAG: type II toxin-antitoxin system PemK/MazF family toxin [Gemmatimonadetes bacterium]|nr:type II toxin-antitoxin system PemK/MazF family toxin [Gemmatimonadota bacterium]
MNFPPPSAERGSVQSGRRPAVVVSANETLLSVPVALVVPGTTKLAATRFPHTVRVDPSATNGLTQPSVFIAFQLQAVNPSLIDARPVGVLDEAELRQLEDAVLGALGFDPPE